MANKKPTTGQPTKADNKDNNNYEVNSYTSIRTLSDIWLGFDILQWYTPQQLEGIIRDPMGNNQILRDLSLIMYSSNGIYTQTVDYMTALATLSKVVVPHGTNAKRKQRNKDLMISSLRTIRDKEFVRDALMRGMIEGVAFYYVETTAMPTSKKKFMRDYDVESITEINDLGLNISIISLPADYTKIVGRKNDSYVIAFNLDYISKYPGEPTESKLRKFPKEIRDAWNKYKDNKTGAGNWVVLDEQHTIVHKIRSKRDEPWGRPLVLAAIEDILYGDDLSKTKRNVMDNINNQIYYQTFPEGKEKGSSALTKQQQEKQHSAVKQAVLHKNNRGGTSFFSVAAGTKINAIEAPNSDILDEKYEKNLGDKIAMDLGIAGSLLNGSASGAYSSQTLNVSLLSSQVFQWIDQITAELNKCLNSCVIKDKRNYCELYYLPITYLNRKEMTGYMKDLYMQTGGSMSAYIAACGIEPDAYFALLDQEYEAGIFDKYVPHPTSYTTSFADVQAGRPETDDPSDVTVATRASGSNDNPSPSDL